MANQFINTDWVSMEPLRFLVNSLTTAKYFNTDWEGDYKKEFAPGATIQVKFPQSWTIRNGLDYSPQGVNRISTTVACDEPFGIDFDWDDVEVAIKLERSKQEISDQYMKPAGLQLGQEWNSRAAQWAYINASNVIGALGTNPSSVTTYYNVRQRLMELACPEGDRCMLVSSSMMATLGGAIYNIFQPPDELTAMFKKGALGTLAGFEWFEENSLYSMTLGTWNSSVTVTGAGQNGSTLTITGTAGDTIKAGNKISIANVNQVNPRTRRIVGPATAKNFTVTQDYTLTAGPDTISILPAIYGPGSQYQNVDALPADGAALTLMPGTASPNGKVGTMGLALSKYAFALVGLRLYTPDAVEEVSQSQDPETKIPLRFVHAWDPVHSMNVHRFDTFGGFGNLYQDNGACCVAGA